MANVQLQPPKSFDLKNPDSWLSWTKRFEQFCIASDLSKTEEVQQISMLLYCIGLEAESVRLNYHHNWPEKEIRHSHCQTGLIFHVRKNTIFERAIFNCRQGEDETAKQFITALFAIAENCNLRAVHTTKIMRIKCESIRIARIHTEAALTAMRIQCAFGQSTSIGGLKPVCNRNPLIT